MTNKIRNEKGQFIKGVFGKNHIRFNDQASLIRARCVLCGAEVRIKPSRYKLSKSKQFYCCWDHYKKDKRITLRCENCKKIILFKKSRLKIKNAGRFCSKSCRAKKTTCGHKNSQWKGGKTKSKGYVLIHAPGHKYASKNYVEEHRLVMERKIGRYLRTDEIVHHINGIKNDNRVENLQIMTPSEHSIHHNNLRWNKQ